MSAVTEIALVVECHYANVDMHLTDDHVMLRGVHGEVTPDLIVRVETHESAVMALLRSEEGRMLRMLLEMTITPTMFAGLALADLTACVGLSRRTLITYLRARERRLQRLAKGIAPKDWTHACHCSGCGPVLLWIDAPAQVESCPWCAYRKAGGMPPRPATATADANRQAAAIRSIAARRVVPMVARPGSALDT